MSTVPRPTTGNRALSVVSAQPDVSNSAAGTVLRQWDCEHQLVGALMYQRATAAAPILHLVPDTAIWWPDNRWAYEIIQFLVAEGRDPDPAVVLSVARHRPPADAVATAEAPSVHRHHQFAVHLANLYTQTVSADAVRQYAREVLDNAYRRAIAHHGANMQQLAENSSSRTQLTDYLTTMRAELADLWRRAEAAARTPG